MEGHGGRASVGVSVLSVGATLSRLVKAQTLEDRHHLTRLEDWRSGHD
jgi:hypothetical protein